jgi:hypothetical protein
LTDLAALLKRHRPILRYDRQEVYFADSAAEWTDNPRNELRTRSGRLVAAATPADAEPRLSLAFLAAGAYPGGLRPSPDDRIGDASGDYTEQARRLHAKAAYRNQMYGRWAVGSDGRTWLQYWFFYFYNDYNLAGGLGLHEGDWEMVQFRMGEGGDAPDLAVYAQHRWAEVAPWDEVEKPEGRPDTPVVYVGRGSHASYFHAGYHETEAWYDLADGKRSTPELALEAVDDREPSWVAWPGMWGDTRPRIPGLEQGSPTAPCRHGQWAHPAALLDQARTVERGPAAPAPAVQASRGDGHLQLAYDFRGGPNVDRLVVTVNSEDDAIQPRTFTFVVDTAPSGTIDTSVELKPSQRYDVYVSAVDAEGRPTESALTLIRPVGAKEPEPVPVLPWLGRVVYAIRRLFRS